MKTITIPADIQISDAGPQDDRSVSFKEFLLAAMDRCEIFGRGIAGVRQGVKIAAAIETGNGTLALEDADFAALRQAVEAMQYNPKVARHLLPYFEAMEAAK